MAEIFQKKCFNSLMLQANKKHKTKKGENIMIRKVADRDYNNVKKLVLQVHKLHVENRPDIYLDNEPIPLEYFNISRGIFVLFFMLLFFAGQN